VFSMEFVPTYRAMLYDHCVFIVLLIFMSFSEINFHLTELFVLLIQQKFLLSDVSNNSEILII
jgi:hypothetical protein